CARPPTTGCVAAAWPKPRWRSGASRCWAGRRCSRLCSGSAEQAIVKPFLLLASRAEDAAADTEYEAFLRYGGLVEDQLHRVRMEAGPLPEITLADYSGVIVGGSPFNSSDPVESKSPVQRRVETELTTLLDQIVHRDFPFLGACYGIASLGVH